MSRSIIIFLLCATTVGLGISNVEAARLSGIRRGARIFAESAERALEQAPPSLVKSYRRITEEAWNVYDQMYATRSPEEHIRLKEEKNKLLIEFDALQKLADPTANIVVGSSDPIKGTDGIGSRGTVPNGNHSSDKAAALSLVYRTAPVLTGVTDLRTFGVLAVKSDLSDLMQQKEVAKGMLYSRGFIYQPYMPLFVYENEVNEESEVDQLIEIANSVWHAGGQLVVICLNAEKLPEGITRLLELEQQIVVSSSKGNIKVGNLKVYTNVKKLSGSFRDTSITAERVVCFAADFMVVPAGDASGANEVKQSKVSTFPTTEAAVGHWNTTSGRQ